MADPLFWLVLSFLLVVVSLTTMLMVAIPALKELGRAARSAEKMFDTLNRELPPTLEAIRLTGLEITELTDDVTDGIQSAGQVAQQVNQSISSAQTGAKRINTSTKSALAGAKAAWRTLTGESPQPRSQPLASSEAATPRSLPGDGAARSGLEPSDVLSRAEPRNGKSESSGGRLIGEQAAPGHGAAKPALEQPSLEDPRLDSASVNRPSVETPDLPPR
ncbi:MAG: DUF948 domain-containing protein [Cyanobacteria bacterium J06638_6]